MKEEAGRVKDDGDKLIKAGRSKVAEAADAVKNAAVVSEFWGKEKSKM